ncbi:hypothetical protein RZR97_12725 [Hydrogenimonas thermophila]|uniref:hypothetical protein n=1 Tax=Hydrogenimonas thermophila TaxID=223786 RepID=UPI0029372CC9|nr:hypothetical protein [Hydrogenimonas thermophila]WOE69948.1 hypothetical protein RZR91_12730 [Hydrogenimonas thermophila]WOE72465.1 hypothetical protein RZR97_12725 [Hydrogenimonas thermophila]
MFKEFIKFLAIWFVVQLLIQIIFFGSCFEPFCIMAALPLTGVVVFVLLFFSKGDKKESKSEEDILFDFVDEIEKEILDEIKAKQEIKHIKSKKELAKALKQLQDKDTKSAKKTEQDPLKAKGDEYEKYIGRKFEDKGELVIYNGLIRGYEDKGVDLISICNKTDTINLIQCKNWTQKSMRLEDIQKIYTKLSQYDFDFFDLSIWEINNYLKLKKDHNRIRKIIKSTKQNFKKFKVRKTLYISSDKVIDLNIGKHLTMIKPNIFKYKDMKIVVHQKNHVNNQTKREIKPKVDHTKKYNYKDLPIIDGKYYNGRIRVKYHDNNEHILLEIENVGTFKIRLPRREQWSKIQINEPFVFVREKYCGTGKNSDCIYSKLRIVDRK